MKTTTTYTQKNQFYKLTITVKNNLQRIQSEFAIVSLHNLLRKDIGYLHRHTQTYTQTCTYKWLTAFIGIQKHNNIQDSDFKI